MRLQDLMMKYLRYGLHEGICVTVNALGEANVAPMGVEVVNKGSDMSVVIRPYPETRTSINLRQVPEFTLNFTHDPVTFFNAVLHKQALTLLPSRFVHPPRLCGGIDLVLECKVNEHYRGTAGRDLVVGSVINAFEGDGSKMAYSRGASAVIEALVYLTKLIAMASGMGIRERAGYLKRIKEICSLPLRTGSEELRCMCIAVLELAEKYASQDALEKVVK